MRRPDHLRLSTVLTWALLVAAIAPLGAFFAMRAIGAPDADALHRAQLAAEAEAFAARVGRYQRDLMSTFVPLAPLIADGRGSAAEPALRNLGVTRACVLNPSTGLVMARLMDGETPCPSQFPDDQLQAIKALAGQGFSALSDRASDGEAPGFSIAARSYDVLVAARVAHVRFDALVSGAGGPGGAFILDRAGQVAAPLGAVDAAAQDYAGLAPVRMALTGQATVHGFTAPGTGTEMLAAAAPVPETGWAVLLTRPAVPAGVGAGWQGSLAALAMALIAAGLIGGFLSRHINRQILATADPGVVAPAGGQILPGVTELARLGRIVQGAMARTTPEDEAKTPEQVLEPTETALVAAPDGTKDDTDSETRATLPTGAVTGEAMRAAEPLDLADLVLDTARMVQPHAIVKGLQLFVRVPPDNDTWVLGDVGALRQLLLQLLGNAVKFSGSGHVSVDLTLSQDGPDDRMIRLIVTDTGAGMSEVQLDQIFASFDAPRSPADPATGLVLCSRIIDAAGGSLSIESQPGKGTEVEAIVRLPAAAASSDRLDDAQGLPERVALVASHPAQRELLCGYLEYFGFQGGPEMGSATGPLALRLEGAPPGPPDVVLCELIRGDVVDGGLISTDREGGETAPSRCVILVNPGDTLPEPLGEALGDRAVLLEKPTAPAGLRRAIAAPVESLRDQPDPIGPMPKPETDGKRTDDPPTSGPDSPPSQDATPAEDAPVGGPVEPDAQDRDAESETAPSADPGSTETKATDGPVGAPGLSGPTATPQDAEPDAQDARMGDDAPVDDDATSPQAAHQGVGNRILIVDPDAASQTAMAMVLDELDLHAVFAKDGETALKELEKGDDFSIVLIDIASQALGTFTPMRLLRELADRAMKPGTFVIAMIGPEDRTVSKQLVTLGITHIVRKPFKTATLRRILQSRPQGGAEIRAAM